MSLETIENMDLRLVAWSKLPLADLHNIFPDVRFLGDMFVEFDTVELSVYRYTDASGRDAFAFDRGDGVTSYGAQTLSMHTIRELRRSGAEIN